MNIDMREAYLKVLGLHGDQSEELQVEDQQVQVDEDYEKQNMQYRKEAVKNAERILAAVRNEKLHGCKYISRNLQDMADEMENQIENSEKYSMKEEVEQLDEANFAATMKKAIAAHERGDHKRAKYHLDNAKTARYAMKSTEISKNKEMLDKYEKLRAMHEGVDLEEGLFDKFKQGMKAGQAKQLAAKAKEHGLSDAEQKRAMDTFEKDGMVASIKYIKSKSRLSEDTNIFEEMLDELSKSTLQSYQDKAKKTPAKNSWTSRVAGMARSAEKLKKEDLDAETLEFANKLAESGFDASEIESIIAKLSESKKTNDDEQVMGDNLSDGEIDFVDQHEVEVTDGAPQKADHSKKVTKAAEPKANPVNQKPVVDYPNKDKPEVAVKSQASQPK